MILAEPALTGEGNERGAGSDWPGCGAVCQIGWEFSVVNLETMRGIDGGNAVPASLLLYQEAVIVPLFRLPIVLRQMSSEMTLVIVIAPRDSRHWAQ